jgi:hypothetical protein
MIISAASPLPPILGDYIDACAANEFVSHAESLKRKYPMETSIDWEWAPTTEEGKKAKEEYLAIKGKQPPDFQKIIDELQSKFEQAKKVADIVKRIDGRLNEAVQKQSLEPLEVVQSCVSYIDSLSQKVNCCVLKLKHELIIKPPTLERAYILPEDLVTKHIYIVADDLPQESINFEDASAIIHVKPDSEFYVVCGKIYRIKICRPGTEGSVHDMTIEQPVGKWMLNKEEVETIKSEFNSGPVTKNTLVGPLSYRAGRFSVKKLTAPMPAPMKASFVKAELIAAQAKGL